MSDRELGDRLIALEALTVRLVRTLHRIGTVSDGERDDLLDAVKEYTAYDAGTAYATERLAKSVRQEPTPSDGGDSLMTHIKYMRRLYPDAEA